MTWIPLKPTPIPWPEPDKPQGGFTAQTWAEFRKSHPERCRDCGTTKNINGHSGSDGPICDGCAQIDRCRPHSKAPHLHTSHWGRVHPAHAHAKYEAEREIRRTKYLASIGGLEPEQEALF